jgi:hypothetical protein
MNSINPINFVDETGLVTVAVKRKIEGEKCDSERT